jgi:hypothetical protein
VPLTKWKVVLQVRPSSVKFKTSAKNYSAKDSTLMLRISLNQWCYLIRLLLSARYLNFMTRIQTDKTKMTYLSHQPRKENLFLQGAWITLTQMAKFLLLVIAETIEGWSPPLKVSLLHWKFLDQPRMTLLSIVSFIVLLTTIKCRTFPHAEPLLLHPWLWKDDSPKRVVCISNPWVTAYIGKWKQKKKQRYLNCRGWAEKGDCLD